jgi:hypothetical protein
MYNDRLFEAVLAIAGLMSIIMLWCWTVDWLVLWKIKREQRGWDSVRQRKEAGTHPPPT